MSSVRTFSSSLGLALLVAGCNPYSNFEGDFYAGDADPENFPIPYRGHTGATAANRFFGGIGTFFETPAFTHGTQTGYFTFPLSPMAPADPLALVTGGNPVGANPTPNAYVFDPQMTDPFRASPRCRAPNGYTFDQAAEAFPLTDQYNIFTALPAATYQMGVASSWSYIPIEREIQVTSNGEACQGIKSEKALLNCPVAATCSATTPGKTPRTDVAVGMPSGKYLGWAIIDPGAAVFRANQLIAPPPYSGPAFTGLPGVAPPQDPTIPTYGLNSQRFGFYAQFLVAYIDGGYVPTQDVMVGTPPVTQTRIVVQRTYIPRSFVTAIPTAACAGMICAQGQVCAGMPATCQACTATGATACPAGQTCIGGVCSAVGAVGRGYEVLQGGRGDPNCPAPGPGQQCYSPVCEVWTYAVPGAPTGVPVMGVCPPGLVCTGTPTLAANLPTDETTILGYTPAASAPIQRFYCLSSK